MLALTGELGCGKTLLTRGICDGLGVPERRVNSPTFVLVNEYQGRLPVIHMDLYRLSGVSEGLEIGLLDYLAKAGSRVTIVEWAEKIVEALPDDRLDIQFKVLSSRSRELTLTARSARYDSLFKELARK